MEVVRPGLSVEAVATTHTGLKTEPRMDIHKNARTTPHSRMLMIERLRSGWAVAEVAQALGVDPGTVRKWRDRFAAEGEAGLADRSSRPHHSPDRLGEREEAAILALRRDRLSGPAIARRLARPVSTIGVVLRRHGLGRLSALDPRPPVTRSHATLAARLQHSQTTLSSQRKTTDHQAPKGQPPWQ